MKCSSTNVFYAFMIAKALVEPVTFLDKLIVYQHAMDSHS